VTRTSAEIAAGLAIARPGRPIEAGTRIHIMGVGGAASAGAALHAAAVGAIVTGCDAAGPDPLSRVVEAAGIALTWVNDPTHVVMDGSPIVDRLAVTKAVTSVDPDHPELRAARRHGIEPESVQQVIADSAATRGQRLIGVTGTHGKSTTSGWLLHILEAAGADPSGFVGAQLPSSITGGPRSVARFGTGADFVVEADEYAANFEPYHPGIALLISAEWDHPDVFADEAAVVTAFRDWVVRAPILVVNRSDAGADRVVSGLGPWSGRRIDVRLVGPDETPPAADPAADRTIIGRIIEETGDGTDLEIAGLGSSGDDAPVRTRLRLLGRHMAIDGLMAAGGALAAGTDVRAIVDGLASFDGVGRRFELKGDVGGVIVLDDYAHHPTAIRATYAAARTRYPGRRLWAVYEPLTYHRTAAMLDSFAQVLSEADRSVVIDIWAVRDPDRSITSAARLADATSARGRSPSVAPGSPEATAGYLADHVEPGDVVLVMGGGRSYVAADRLVTLLTERETETV
jgi:UDP-N-acetylmuramate--alanine ligase